MNSTATFLPAGSVTASGPADAARQTRTYLDTPIGWIRLLAIDGVVTELSATEPHEARCPPTGPPLHPATFKQVVSELRAYFAGRLRRFTSPIALRATSFEERVWREVLRISYGETRSYRDIAIAIGQPDAVRAVGAANGRNPIAIIVPCHRVIGSDRRLTGYSGGLDRKQSLLDLEGATGWRRSSSAASAPATRTK